MIRFAAIVTWLVLCVVPVAAQERRAAVKLDDGREFQGTVLALDLQTLELDVGDKILRIPAARIRSCRFEEVAPAAGQEPGGEPAADPAAAGEPSAAAQQPPAAPLGETPATEPPATEPAGTEPAATEPAATQTAAGDASPPSTATEEGAAPAEAKAGEPAGAAKARRPAGAGASPERQANQSLWRHRLELLDQAYPWLAPSAPSQWISLGLLLLVGSSLMVHMSVNVAGAEGARLGRSCGLGIAYLVVGLLQVATVPVQDFSVALMLLANTTVALFALCGLFGLLRGQAIVALVVQLGFGVLVYGILELVTALLGSVGVAP